MSSKYALIIATTEYADPNLGQLSAPGKDAEDFAMVLKDEKIADFDDVKILLNHSEADVREAIDEFFDRKRSDDMLLLYFSGHGVRDEMGALYLALKNTNLARLRATGVKSDFIREAMDHSFSKRQILILDCCNSGAFSHGSKATTGGSMGTATAFKGNGYGRVILTASDATQLAWEGNRFIGETQNSLFTHYLIQGLRGDADRDDDGKITVDDLYDYTYEQIISTNPKQTPGKWSFNQKGEIILCLQERVKPVVVPSILPLDLVASLEDTRDWVREGAILRLEKILKGDDPESANAARKLLENLVQEGDARDISLMAKNILLAMIESPAAQETTLDEIQPKTEGAKEGEESAIPSSQIKIVKIAEKETLQNLTQISPGTPEQAELGKFPDSPKAEETQTIAPLQTIIQEAVSHIPHKASSQKAINFKMILGLGFAAVAITSTIAVARFLLNNNPEPSIPAASSQPATSFAVFNPTEELNTKTPTVEAKQPTVTPTEPAKATVTIPAGPLEIGSTTTGRDGATLVYIPSGAFTMGVRPKDALDICKINHSDCQLSWFNDEQISHTVSLSAFWIDQTEVTNKQYRACVEDGGCAQLENVDSYRRPNYAIEPAYDNFPVIYVDWNAANAYCKWAGRRLPTEAEWEKAARGENGYPYPWGDERPNNDILNYNSSIGDTTEAGSYPAGQSSYGSYDMAGNLWEWVGDWYAETYYYNSPSENPLGPETGSFRVARGGAWNSNHNDIRTSNRNKYAPDSVFIYVGFRCALPIP